MTIKYILVTPGKSHPSFCLLGGQILLTMIVFPHKSTSMFCILTSFPNTPLVFVQRDRESAELGDLALNWEPLAHYLPNWIL